MNKWHESLFDTYNMLKGENLKIHNYDKYEIKNILVEFLTPYFATVASKEEAVEIVKDMTPIIKSKCDKKLKEKGIDLGQTPCRKSALADLIARRAGKC